MTRLIAIAAVVVTITLLGLGYLLTQPHDGQDQYAQCRAGAVAGGAGSIGGSFELISENNDTVTDADVIDQPSLLYVGYTFCPDVCPFDMARNAEATDILDKRGLTLQPVFISVDPARDTPEVLREYTDFMHSRALGLTGSRAQIDRVVKAYRAYYNIHPPADVDDEFYLVDHSTFSYLVMPGDGFVEFFRRDMSAEDMADRIQCFIEAA